jgi:hypothetical protein
MGPGGGVLLALHLGASAVWLGALAFVLVDAWPLWGRGHRDLPVMDAELEAQSCLARIGTLLRLTLPAMVIALGSGWGLAFQLYGRPLYWPGAVTAMQAAGVAMAAVLILLATGPFALSSQDRDVGETTTPSQARRLLRLVAIDLVFGVLALVIAVLGPFG